MDKYHNAMPANPAPCNTSTGRHPTPAPPSRCDDPFQSPSSLTISHPIEGQPTPKLEGKPPVIFVLDTSNVTLWVRSAALRGRTERRPHLLRGGA